MAVTVVADHRGTGTRSNVDDATQIVYAGTDVLRARVHHDHSYDFQSHASVEVWRDGWKEVARLGGTDVGHPDKTFPALYALAAMVLRPAEER